MAKAEDLTEQKFNHLTAKYRGENTKKGSARWWCECDCGNPDLVLIYATHLKSGHTKSCGCHNQKMKSISHKKYNEYDLETFDYGVCFLKDGDKVLFDKEDYDLIKNYYWYKNNFGYPASYNPENQKFILLHKLIMNDLNNNLVIDHIEHNLLDVRKHKLRIGTNQLNSMNRGLQSNNTSGVTGVYWDKSTCTWLAAIKLNRKMINLGHYENKEDAIKVRKEAEEKYFGEWSYDNSMKHKN